jgi:hypothetical protein
MQAVARYIMRGRLQAVLVAAAAALLSLLLPPLNYISSAVIALVTLRKGWNEGLIIIAGAVVAMGLFAVLTPVDPFHAVLLAAVIWVPVWLLALVLRYTVSLSAMVGSSALLGGVVVAAAYLALDDPARTWRDLLGRLLDEARQESETGAADTLGQMLVNAAPHMTGMLAAALMLGLTLSVFLGRWWQAMLYNPGGFRHEFHSLRLGRNFALAALVVLAATMAGSGWLEEVSANILIVVVAAYLLHGLSLLHGIVAAKKINIGWLISVYALTLLLPQSSLLLAAAAFVDSWMNVRARLQKDGQEGHGG